MALLGRHNTPATVSSSGRTVGRLPLLAQDAVRRDYEVSAHGWRWEGHADLGEAEERDRIARSVAAIRTATGIRPVGWHTRSPGSANTRRLLVEEGGFLYDSDAYNDGRRRSANYSITRSAFCVRSPARHSRVKNDPPGFLQGGRAGIGFEPHSRAGPNPTYSGTRWADLHSSKDEAVGLIKDCSEDDALLS
jgi:peptidoglycan/xylan/chitin deacetylase (PgdA/CDA1 family)